MSPSTSTRWCPTPEQLMILEEMYRGGMRTPNASQIQRITAHLSIYGKIEGKNVFYWFQNHKARDRQKLRRKLTKQLYQQQLLQEQLYLHQYHHHNPQNYSNYNVLSTIDPSNAALHQLSHDPPAHEYLHQGRVDGAAAQMANKARKMDPPILHEAAENCMIRSYGDDWSMMIRESVNPTIHCCSNRPLKTLELFPMTSLSGKEQQQVQGTTSKQPNISSSSSTN